VPWDAARVRSRIEKEKGGRGRMQSEVRAYLGSGRECVPCRVVPVDTRI
jgi:hypothetical protein